MRRNSTAIVKLHVTKKFVYAISMIITSRYYFRSNDKKIILKLFV